MLILALTIFGLILVAAAVCFVQIARIERVYRRMFQEEESVPTWRRKRWAFGLLVFAHVLGFSRLVFPWRYTSLVYLGCVCIAFWLFVWAYSAFLKDLKTLPKENCK